MLNIPDLSNVEHCAMYLCGKIMRHTQPLINKCTDCKFNINEICHGLYLGDFSSACNVDKLLEYGITHVVTVIVGVGEMYPNTFKYHVIDICDRTYTEIKKYFNDSVQFIDDAINNGGSVLVHCQKGISRSSTIVAAYLIKKYKYSTTHAINKIKECRDCICPNNGFVKQLEEYERELCYDGTNDDTHDGTYNCSHDDTYNCSHECTHDGTYNCSHDDTHDGTYNCSHECTHDGTHECTHE